MSESAANRALHNVLHAVCEESDLLGRYISFPTPEELLESATKFEALHGLGGVALGVDGLLVKLYNRPSRSQCGPGQIPQDFFSRKMT